ncbi:FFLEELY motif protein [Moraxella nonliquefaciens]|uniref:DUF8198 domain-containing protein n=1 Tax=Moraxella nonliquefaciens TaxID=478 RepID=A0A1B8QIB9_MORNO|nr:hypothetical protein [Moraxella nonliquefaciens]OBX83193.1 hypothetical protein A7456_03835 [Moraxella nonliquefaciens]QPT43693.1 hypothetical protein I6G26_06215 [Moraxella nonliquefaciens]QQC30595.1 hypothetical protein I6H63_05010 [Moraxella nonliquefaciens]
MSQIQTLVDMLKAYQALPHHTSPILKQALGDVQAWQKARIKRTNHALFTDDKTTPLANYLIERIYGNDDFDVLADQLLTAGVNALNGSGRLEKLIPSNALKAGVQGVRLAIDAIALDLALASSLLDDFGTAYASTGINDALMYDVYKNVNAKDERITQVYAIKEVCEQSYQYFNSFILQNAFKLAKGMAYDNGYQPLYDFIGDGLLAIKPLKRIDDFTVPFVANELAIIHEIHR